VSAVQVHAVITGREDGPSSSPPTPGSTYKCRFPLEVAARVALTSVAPDRSVLSLPSCLMKVAVCWEDGVGRPWVVGVGADSSPVLVADGPELFAVLDNPALEWVDPVGVGEPVAEFRGLS
jgi:hypothetical protein